MHDALVGLNARCGSFDSHQCVDGDNGDVLGVLAGLCGRGTGLLRPASLALAETQVPPSAQGCRAVNPSHT